MIWELCTTTGISKLIGLTFLKEVEFPGKAGFSGLYTIYSIEVSSSLLKIRSKLNQRTLQVGFWTVRVETHGQREDLRIKVEKYYLPKFEVYVRMPPFILETENVISVNVLGLYLFEKAVKGDVLVRWYAKIIDGFYPYYHDSVQYRSQYAHYQNKSSRYNRYKSRNIFDEQVSNLNLSNPERYEMLDSSFSPNIEATPVNKWTYISSELRKIDTNEDFYLQIADINRQMGTLTNIQIRAEAFLTEFFYNSTQRGFCESKLINPTLTLKFLGSEPMVFKPGMLFEGTVSITHHDYVPLSKDDLKESSLNINIRAKKQDGSVENLPSIFIPKSLTSDFSSFQDIDWLTHYGQLFGSKAAEDTENNINPAAFFTDDVDKNTEFIFHEIYAREKSFEEFRNTGVHRFRFKVPKLTEELYLSATYSDPINSRDTFTETTVYGAYGPKDKFIHVRSSTKNISVGHYVVFHVQSNFPLPSFDWIIVSKNILVASGREYGSDIHPAVTTFSIVVSSEMAPGFHIMVYSVLKPDDYLISDSAYYPVNTFNRHKIEFKLNQVKDHSKNTLEAIFKGDPGAVFMTSVTRTFFYSSQGKNSVTETSILESLHTFDKSQQHIHKLYTTDRDALYLDKVTYYPSMDYGVDAKRTFESKNLLVFTDYVYIPQTPLTRQCNISLGMFPCLHKGCYTEAQICNGQKDCEDGSDESQCKEEFLELQNDNLGFRLSRFSRFTDYFESGVDIWGWFDINMDEDREQFNTIEVPLITDNWFFSAFSISKTNGIGIIDPFEYVTNRPIHFTCEAPSKVHRGESVGIRCIVMNRSPEDLECLLTLKGSDDYEFIHVEQYGYVTSYSPRTSKGDHQHLVYVRGENEVDVHFPIKPVLSSDQGFISVDLSISTQIMSASQIVSIEIIPEGSIVHRHTSVLLDLKSRAFELEFMNIIVDESPIIPYEIYRRYIFGSPYGKFSLSGDVIGPTFIDGNPASLESMFPDGNGRFGKGTEYHTFNLASNAWQLHYFRLTNQLQSNWELTKSVFEQMNVEYAAVMRRYSSQGWVSNWDAAKPSVWLTAWSIRIFETISFQDWEDYIYVDPEIFQSSILWLINYQNKNGAFIETEFYTNPLHKAMACKIGQGNKTIALTSHVLISLQVTADKIQGETKKYVAHARKRAVHYLEKNLPMIKDPYDLAITAYALALSRSAEADAAYGKLMKMKRIESGMVYWSPTKIETHRVRYEFNRPFLEAKSKQTNDALAVEATGYALLTLFLVEGGGVTILQDQIVEWLNTMRLGVGGFIATVDTIIALEALVTYSYNSRIKDLTDLHIKIEIPDSNITHSLKINGDEVSRLQTFNIPNVWGHINMYATGAGQAVAQMDINYGIDYEPFKDTPPEDCFKLSIYESFRGRNKSEIDVRSCFSWTCTNESENSGMAMLVVDIPTGYIMLQVIISLKEFKLWKINLSNYSA